MGSRTVFARTLFTRTEFNSSVQEWSAVGLAQGPDSRMRATDPWAAMLEFDHVFPWRWTRG